MKEFELRGTCLTVHLPQELDHPNGDIIKKETDLIIRENHVQSIVFDFQNTLFMDSSGIGVIMSRYRALGLRGGCVTATHVNDRIQKILRLSGMHKIIQINEEEERRTP